MLYVALATVGFVLAAYVGYSVLDATVLKKARVRQRIDAMSESGESAASQGPKLAQSREDMLPTVTAAISSQGLADKIMLLLLRAGIKLRPSEFMGIAAGLSLGPGIVVGLLSHNVGALVLVMVVGFAAPFIYAKSMQMRRLVTFNLQLPDALALVGSAIRSGYSFQRALLMVADEMPNPISEEFRRVLNEINVGLPTEAALRRMVERMTSYDLELVVTAVIIQQQVGGNLAEIVDNIASTIRERVRVEGELNALTAEGRISGVVLMGMPVFMAVMISVSSPGYFKPLLEHPMGTPIIFGALGLQVVGWLIIKRMLVLDY